MLRWTSVGLLDRRRSRDPAGPRRWRTRDVGRFFKPSTGRRFEKPSYESTTPDLPLFTDHWPLATRRSGRRRQQMGAQPEEGGDEVVAEVGHVMSRPGVVLDVDGEAPLSGEPEEGF